MTPLQAQLLRLLRRNPDGLGLMDMMTITGRTHYSVSHSLRMLKAAGLVGTSEERGAAVVWAAVEDLDALKEKRAATRAALAAQARERAARREESAQQRAAEEAACEAFATAPPVHRVLAQSDWTGRMPTRGVASVFHMGALA